MITYLTGASCQQLQDAAATTPNLGVLAQPGNRLDRQAGAYQGRMAMDNGCFTKGDAFDLEAYLGHLRTVVAEGNVPLFATAPDVVGDYTATTRRSVPVLALIRELGVPAAYVAQDGMEADLDRVRWDLFDVVFIGGSTEWKLGEGARAVVAAAKAHGKHVHMGRVNSLKRLRYAQAIGCDTADGTFVAFGPSKNAPKVLEWLATLAREASAAALPLAA